MKIVNTIKTISIILLVMLAFLQFAIIISDNYSDLSKLFDSNTPPASKDIFSYDYVSMESIRISDGESNYWDLPRRTDEYYQLQLVANEILKQLSTSPLQYVSKESWVDLLSEKYIMFQYYCTVPLSFVSAYSGKSQGDVGINKIYQLVIHPTSPDMDFYIYDGNSYYELEYDATNDNLLNSIDYDSIFNFIKYTNFYDKNSYKLLGSHPAAYQLRGNNDVKLYMGSPHKYQLAINITPSLIADISTSKDTYDLKELKGRLFGVMQDRFTSSLSSDQKVFFSNMENQYSVSCDGRITYDYFGKQTSTGKGDVDMAYNKALSMMEKVLGLMDEKTSATLVLTDIDYSNPKYYVFNFDYLVEGDMPVYIYDNSTYSDLQHAFTVQASQDIVLKLTGMIRTILTDKQTAAYYENDSVKLLTEQDFHLEDLYIEKLYNGYIMNVKSNSSTLTAGVLLQLEKGLTGIPLVLLQFSSSGGAVP